MINEFIQCFAILIILCITDAAAMVPIWRCKKKKMFVHLSALSFSRIIREGRWRRRRSVPRVFYAVAINQCARPHPGRETDTASRWAGRYLCNGSRNSLLPLSLSFSYVPSRLNALHAQTHRNAALRRDYCRTLSPASRGGRTQCKHGSLDIHLRESYSRMNVIRHCEKYDNCRKRDLL